MASNLETEEELINACAVGEADCWNRFVLRYRRLIRATANRVCALSALSPSELDDMEAHVYEKLLDNSCRRLKAWRKQSKFSTYLVQVTRNLCLDYARRHHRMYRVQRQDEIPEWVNGYMAPADHEHDAKLLATLESGIEHLSEKQAMIMRLRLKGNSLRKIARIMNIPVGTVSVENSRALKRLHRIFASHPVLNGKEQNPTGKKIP